ncbi:hypothetical protein PRIPAC_84653, partial [Pristionchus pacificus]
FKMASTTAAGEPLEQVLEEEIEEETVWDEMDEMQVEHFIDSDKKMRMVYGGQGLQDAVATEEYQEVDVEDYEDAIHIEPVNLPDLISKKWKIGNDAFTLCFSKHGIHQLASHGYLYNLNQADGSPHYTWVCINPECTAQIITSQEIDSMERTNDIHADVCEADEGQLALRIAIYDLRLAAEFTDTSLDELYSKFAASFAQSDPELAEMFPSYGALVRSLKEHRRYRFYKRAFDAARNGFEAGGDKRMDDEIDLGDHTMLLSLGEEEVVEESYAERVPREGELAMRHGSPYLHPYGRMRGWPPTFCHECNVDMPSPSLARPGYSPQYALVQHVNRLHTPVKVNSCVFEPGAFEMWLREVQRCPALRLRRFQLIGEDFYYLCSCDARLPKSKFNHLGYCCTAYVRITDYREVSARRARLVNIEYSFDHSSHELTSGDSPLSPEKLIADLRPDAFLFQMERRKQATAQLVRNRQEMYSMSRKAGIGNPVPLRTMRTSMPARAPPENVFSAARSDSRTAVARHVASKPTGSGRASTMASAAAAAAAALKQPEQQQPLKVLMTRKSNFKDSSVFDAVKQFEQLANIAIRRLQNVKDCAVAEDYTAAMRRLTNRIVSDKNCATEGSAQAIWRGGDEEGRNGRHPASKRPKEEEVEDIEEEEGERKRQRIGGEEGKAKGEEERQGDGGNEDYSTEEDDGPAGGKAVDGDDEGEEGEEDDGEGRGSGGRSQLPVRTTLVATGRVVEAAKERSKTAEGCRQEGKEKKEDSEEAAQASNTCPDDAPPPQLQPMVQPVARRKGGAAREGGEAKSTPPVAVRSKSSRIQARKERIEGEAEGRKD